MDKRSHRSWADGGRLGGCLAHSRARPQSHTGTARLSTRPSTVWIAVFCPESQIGRFGRFDLRSRERGQKAGWVPASVGGRPDRMCGWRRARRRTPRIGGPTFRMKRRLRKSRPARQESEKGDHPARHSASRAASACWPTTPCPPSHPRRGRPAGGGQGSRQKAKTLTLAPPTCRLAGAGLRLSLSRGERGRHSWACASRARLVLADRGLRKQVSACASRPLPYPDGLPSSENIFCLYVSTPGWSKGSTPSSVPLTATACI